MQQYKITKELKAVLKSRHKKYADVAKWLDLSESSVKRLFSRGLLTLPQIETLCEKLKLDFVELVQAANAVKSLPTMLTLKQEQELVADLELFRIFYLLFRKWPARQIALAFSIDEAKLTRYLLALEKLSVIELFPANKVRLLVSPSLKWIPEGPISRIFRSDVVHSFLAKCSETEPDHLLIFVPCELTEDGARRLRKTLVSVARDVQEVTEHEARLNKGRSKGHGILLAMRPWVHPLFESS